MKSRAEFLELYNKFELASKKRGSKNKTDQFQVRMNIKWRKRFENIN